MPLASTALVPERNPATSLERESERPDADRLAVPVSGRSGRIWSAEEVGLAPLVRVQRRLTRGCRRPVRGR
jgi:hypothetical protein